MEPGAEIKFRPRFMLAQSLNLDRAWALAEIKFHARTRCFVKDIWQPKSARLIIYAAQAVSRIGAILDKINQI